MRIHLFLPMMLLAIGLEACKTHKNEITVIGTALNAKRGAVVTTDTSSYYIDGLDFWDEKFYGQKVKVTGILKIEEFQPRTNDSVTVAEIVGTVQTITKPKWLRVQ